MRKLNIALAAAVGSLALAGAAQAQDADSPFKLSFNVGANTDYVFRGISQTDEDPSVFGGVDATIGSIGYAGIWVSNVDFGPGNSTDIEFDIYAGIKPVLGAVTFDFAAIYYGYTDQPSGSNEDYWEFKGAASVPAGPATLGAAVYYSPEFFGKTGDATYFEINAAVPIGETKFSVSGAVGHQMVEGPLDYNTWNLGIGYALTDNIGLDVRYHDTDEHRFGKLYDSRVVAGIKAVF
ncbi:TorF family putative porin [uncultured Phenylobacterium sp.]|uniref:TorF family putative porin n=1 Tax=uncultured Phenylobacterium sp. TaxID=349273 RepID=UPI0025E8EF0F|nr:TorF family putative porin [uncultured Phenylobacterium sp.]